MSNEYKRFTIVGVDYIPKGWKLIKLKHICEIYTGNSLSDSLKVLYTDKEDSYPYIATKDIDGQSKQINYENGIYIKKNNSSFKIADADSVLMCIEGGSAGKKIAFTDRRITFGNKLCCLKSEKFESKFVYYYLNSPAFNEEFKSNLSGLISGVSIGVLKEMPCILPSKEEQKKIIDYLDKKIYQIDKIISQTNNSIDEYKKYKQSIITEILMNGLNRSVEKKDTGVGYIGDIPIHWTIRKIKYVLSPLQRDVQESDEIITCFRDGEVTLRKNRRETGYTLSDTENGYQGVEIGDLVIHGMDVFAGAIGMSDSRGKCTPVVHVCDSKENKNFYMYFLRALAFNDVFMALSDGIRIRSSDFRNWDKLAEIYVVVPPINEQEKIANYIENKCIAIDNIIEQKQKLLAEMEAYKKSLIYECVTGKREVK